MNEQQLKQALHELAQEHVSDDTDIWQHIKAQIKPKRRFESRLIPDFTRTVAAITAILMVSTVVYAVFQLNYCDPALCQAQALITEIDMSETIDGVTITLNWAYADAHRIALQLNGVYTSDEPITRSQTYVLTDSEGREYLPTFYGGGGGGGGWSVDAPHTFTYDSSVSFHLPPMDRLPDSLTLRLEVTVIGFTNTPEIPGDTGGGGLMPLGNNPPNDPSASGDAAGSGGGGNDPFSGQQPVEPIGPFVFEFTIPLIPALVLDDVQSTTVHDVTMTLQQIAITPSLTRADLCFVVPDSTEQWLPRAMLSDDTQDIPAQGMEIVTNPDATCYRVSFLMPYTPDEPIDWTLTIARLVGQPNYTSEQMVASLQERGIDAEAFPGGGFGIMNAPDNIDIIINEIEDMLSEAKDGPWEFTIHTS